MLEIKELTRVYGRFTALNRLSIQIGDGELHGFVGPNGAGKSTTMRILATLLPPTSGTAVMDGVDVRKAPRRMRELIGYMPDFFGVYDRLKTWEYLDFYARCYGFSYQERMRMIDQLLELVRRTFDFRPAAMIRELGLRAPLYRQTAAYGHFGRLELDLPWERTGRL